MSAGFPWLLTTFVVAVVVGWCAVVAFVLHATSTVAFLLGFPAGIIGSVVVFNAWMDRS